MLTDVFDPISVHPVLSSQVTSQSSFLEFVSSHQEESWAFSLGLETPVIRNQTLEGKYEGEDVRSHLLDLSSTEVAGDLFYKT